MVVNLFSFVIKTQVEKETRRFMCFEWTTRVFCVRLEHKTRISRNTSSDCCLKTQKKETKKLHNKNVKPHAKKRFEM